MDAKVQPNLFFNDKGHRSMTHKYTNVQFNIRIVKHMPLTLGLMYRQNI